jgi:hypothetical protein
MQPEQPQPASTPMWMVVFGWLFSLLVGALFVFGGVMKITGANPGPMPDIGWQESAMFGLGIVEVSCAVLYLFPPTAILGAVLLTGYMGGAMATHLRIGDAFLIQLLIGVFLWFGLFLRDARIRACLPWRSDPDGVPYVGCMAFLLKMFLVLLVIVGVSAALIEATPADYRISRSITMDAPVSKAFEQVNDFHKWDAWSPFEKTDPDLKRKFEGPASGTGAIYKWVGNDQAGEGSMTMTESVPNERIRIKFQMMKPLEFASDVDFTFTPQGDKTVVSWTMRGHSDDFKDKAIIVMMQFIVGTKYGEGLEELKRVVEKK